jgi:hypothetical protein
MQKSRVLACAQIQGGLRIELTGRIMELDLKSVCLVCEALFLEVYYPVKFFLKLNRVSAIFALLPFITLEFMVNVYRISRLSGLEIGTVDRLSINTHKASYLTALLWVPYFIVYVRIFMISFPMSNPATTRILLLG